ncbi:MAG: FapA family protein [Methylococcales bacterium]|nr:FapA family protein [Methylococcales bacterium]MDD5755512.1 FapA family protein [Methylococcales bacterium]
MNDATEYGLNFKLGFGNRKLFAVVTAHSDQIKLSPHIIQECLEKATLSHLFINEYSVHDLVYRYNYSANEAFEFEIGEVRDASCEIHISEDNMQARLTLTLNFGGKEVTLSDVQQLLQDKSIVWGITPTENIEAVLANGEVSDFLIARGLEMIPGVDAQFLSLLPDVQQRERKPLVDDDGIVDYRELGSVVIVNQNDVLMVRIPPIQGKKGRNIFGEIVLPSGGEDTPFSGDKKGICLNPENENQLISSITGQPVLVPNGIIVLPVLTVKRVDLLSGNIRFDGSVIVTGDVKDGMKVYALEDIVIEGNVASAILECMGSLVIKGSVTGNCELIANGDVVIKGGIQGYSKSEHSKEDEHSAKIITRGSVNIGFVENFTIEAGGDIVIDKYSMNTHLMSQNKIVVGNKNIGRKSSIIGGVTWAMTMVKGTIIGSSAGIATRIQVGINPYVQKRMIAIKNALIPNSKSQNDIRAVLSFMDEHPEKRNEDTLEKLYHTLSKLIIEADAYHDELNELVVNTSSIDHSKVIATLGVYPGTEIQINNVLWKAQENRGRSVFRVVKREISINSR